MAGELASQQPEIPSPQVGSQRQPLSHLHDGLDSFIRDGLSFESLTQGNAGHHRTGAPSLPVGPGQHAAPPITAAELHSLLDFDPCNLDLDMSLPNIFGDGDGNELFDLEFPGLNKIIGVGDSQPHPNHDPMAAQKAADAARNVLASLQVGSSAELQSPGTAGSTDSPAGVPTFSFHLPPMQIATTMQVEMHPDFQMPFMGAAAASFFAGPRGSYAFLPGAPVNPNQLDQDAWMHPLSQQQFASLPGMAPTMNMASAMQFMAGIPPNMSNQPLFSAAAERHTKGKGPAKRRRKAAPSAAATAAAAQANAKADQGYTFDPTTGRLYRHGPALVATTRDNREIPTVKAIFNTFQAFGNFAGAPTTEYSAYAQQALGGTAAVPTQIPQNPVIHHHQQQQQLYAYAADPSPAPSTSSSHLHMQIPDSTAATPVQRQVNPPTTQKGHGFITSLVTKELKESTPPPQPTSVPTADAPPAPPLHLRGIFRNNWELFWDAFIEVAGAGPNSNQIVFLGKFPTQEQAGRAHDIAALKLYADAAQTNFPKEDYASALAVLQAHTAAEVVAAIQKDSALAMRRTSKHKGVRRVGPDEYEARVDVAMLSAGMPGN